MKKLLFSALLIALFTSCASYDKTAYVHSSESVRDEQPVERVVFTIPNGRTFEMEKSNYFDGTGSLAVTRVPSRSVNGHNFNQSGGLIGTVRKGYQSIKVGSSVLLYKEVYKNGRLHDKFRILRRYCLVPVN